MAEAELTEWGFFPTDITFLRIVHGTAQITWHLAPSIKATRGNVQGWEWERSSGYQPTWGSITQRSPGNLRWCVRVSQRKVFSLLHIGCQPCSPLILEVKWARPLRRKLIDYYWRITELQCWELAIGRKVERRPEPALWAAAAAGHGLLTLIWGTRPQGSRGVQASSSGAQVGSRNQAAGPDSGVGILFPWSH